MDLFDIGEGFSSLEEGLSRVKCPAMVIGVQTDILFPIKQQRDLAKKLEEAGRGFIKIKLTNSCSISNTIHYFLYCCTTNLNFKSNSLFFVCSKNIQFYNFTIWYKITFREQ